MNCLSLLLILFVSFNPEAQADAWLNFAPMGLWGDRERVTFDESGCLWLAYRGVGSRRDIYAARIDRSGKTDVGPVLVYKDKEGDPEYPILGYRIACDRWNNAYFIYAISGATHIGYAHLIRVNPEGEVNNYDPWPEKHTYNPFIDILPGDTLFLVSNYQSGGGRIAKALIEPDKIIPVQDSFYSEILSTNVGSRHERVGSYLDWEKRLAMRTMVLDKDLYIVHYSLKPSDNYKSNKSGPYPWRSYIWRSYLNSAIPYPIWAEHKEGGYTLCFLDPEDKSTVYVIRLDEAGVPIDPSTLDKGGTLSARHFKNLPSSAEPHVDFWIWRTHKKRTPRDSYFELDSARVIFWGCDDKGNLYAYRKVKKF